MKNIFGTGAKSRKKISLMNKSEASLLLLFFDADAALPKDNQTITKKYKKQIDATLIFFTIQIFSRDSYLSRLVLLFLYVF